MGIQMDVDDGLMKRTFEDGTTANFKPLQLHFHAPSEHTVDGKHYDLKMHIVHLYEDGSLGGVLGVMFDRSADTTDESDEFIGSLDFANATTGGNNVVDVNLLTDLIE